LAFSVSFRRRRDTTLGIRIGRRRNVGRPKIKKKKNRNYILFQFPDPLFRNCRKVERTKMPWETFELPYHTQQKPEIRSVSNLKA
jgi:hypothetical protein